MDPSSGPGRHQGDCVPQGTAKPDMTHGVQSSASGYLNQFPLEMMAGLLGRRSWWVTEASTRGHLESPFADLL